MLMCIVQFLNMSDKLLLLLCRPTVQIPSDYLCFLWSIENGDPESCNSSPWTKLLLRKRTISINFDFIPLIISFFSALFWKSTEFDGEEQSLDIISFECYHIKANPLANFLFCRSGEWGVRFWPDSERLWTRHLLVNWSKQCRSLV